MGLEHLKRKSQPWQVKPHHFFDETQKLREAFADLIGSEASDIAIIPSVSYGIGVAAKNLPVNRGEHILVLDEQFPSNVYPWRRLAQENAAKIRTVPRPEDFDWTTAILNAIDHETAIVALPHCHWTDGSMINLEEIGARCDDQGKPLVLDVTQSLGALPLDIKKVKPAFLVAAGYKWLFGPYSLGYMYVHPRFQGGVPLEDNWITRKDSENFSGLVNYTDELAPGAIRFDMGERSNFALAPMSLTALNLLRDWTPARIAQALRSYNQKIISGMESLGFRAVPEAHRSPHLLGLRYKGALPDQLATKLADENIFVSIRGDAIRISPHLYNNDKDLDHFFEVMGKVM